VGIRDIPLTTIDGAETSLEAFADKVVLIVNVASRCGLSPQYEKLEALQRRYESEGFSVIGFPSNQFHQELGSEEAIKTYCSSTWGITFPLFARVRVNGRDQHPLYGELTKVADGEGKAGRVRWNFEKFLLSPAGEVTRFRPRVQPDDPAVVSAIESALAQLRSSHRR
jgi:glutathione peroxidase